MTKILCAQLDCEYHSGKGICAAKEIDLTSSSIMTLHDGRRRFNKCRTYKQSNQAYVMEQQLIKLLEGDYAKRRTD